MIDSLEIGSDSDMVIDPDDILFDPSKVDDTGIFPMSVPRDNIRRSKSRKKKLTNQFALNSKGCDQPDCQDCPTPDFGERSSTTAFEIGYIVYSGVIGSGNFYIFICGTSYTFFDGTPYIGFIVDGTFFSGLFYFGVDTIFTSVTPHIDHGHKSSGRR